MTTIKAPSGGYDVPMYNRQGVRISLDEWAMLFSEGRSASDPTAGYHRIGYDTIGPFTISTVWRGLDHREFLGGEPLIFETCVMSPHQDDQIIRYATEAEARETHAAIIEKVRMVTFVSGALRRLFEGREE